MIDLFGNSAFVRQRITQHKRFVPNGTHPNPSLTLRTSFMLGTLCAIRKPAFHGKETANS